MKTLSDNKYLLYPIAALAGASLTLAFAPINFYWLAIISPAILLQLWLSKTSLRAFWIGLVYGLGFFGTGVSWIYISIHRYGNAPIGLAIFITILFVSILALFFAVQGYLLARFFPKNNVTKFLLAFPANWVLLEWLRSWLFTGFPWLLIAESQITSPLRGFIPMLGELGVAFITLLSSGLLVHIFQNMRCWYKSAIPFIAIYLLGSICATIQWTHPAGELIQVSLIQGNVPQELKWSREYIQPIFTLYETLIQQQWNSKLILLPEGAMPLPHQQSQPYLSRLAKKAKQHKTTIIVGLFSAVPNNFSYYNSMLAIGSTIEALYHKRHLVPFGEFIPSFPLLRWLMSSLSIPMSDIASGAMNQAPISIGKLRIAPFLCYEIAYSDILLSALPDANLLITLSDDAWFGESLAPWQHLQIAQFRALQTGRYLLLSTNNGITAIIRPNGTLQAVAPPFEQYVLTGTIQAMQGNTPWSSIGNIPFILLLVTFLIIAKKLQNFSNN